ISTALPTAESSGHTLAFPMRRRPGRVGNPGKVDADIATLLDRARTKVEPAASPPPQDAAAIRAQAVATYLAAREAAELEAAAAELRRAERRADAIRRRIDRQSATARRQTQVAKRRAAGGMFVGEKRSPNRPTHVDVDPVAWQAVKADAIRRRVSVGTAVG